MKVAFVVIRPNCCQYFEHYYSLIILYSAKISGSFIAGAMFFVALSFVVFADDDELDFNFRSNTSMFIPFLTGLQHNLLCRALY